MLHTTLLDDGATGLTAVQCALVLRTCSLALHDERVTGQLVAVYMQEIMSADLLER